MNAIARIYAYLFGRKIFRRWNQILLRLSISGLGILNYKSPRESGEQGFVRRHLRYREPGSCVMDVGANKGLYSKMCLHANPRLRIYSIEPHPVTYEQLTRTLAGTNAVPRNVAMGDFVGSLQLYDYADADGSMHASVYKDVIEDIHGSKSVSHTVKATTVDEFMAQEGIESLVLLKIDAEGHDLRVLKGARQAIDSGKIQAIHFEFSEMNVISRAFFRDFLQALDGYDFYRLLPHGWMSLRQYSPLYCELFAYQNIVAILRGTLSPG